MMKSPSKLKSGESPLFLDAGVLVNLIASDHIQAIYRALNRPLLIERGVLKEITHDPRVQGGELGVVEKLVKSGILDIVAMDNDQLEVFMDLTGAPVPDDLADCEAAIIACAVGRGHVIIDEPKAHRIIGQQFDELISYSTLDLICSSQVCSALGELSVREALQGALHFGGMRVPEIWRPYITSLLKGGDDC